MELVDDFIIILFTLVCIIICTIFAISYFACNNACEEFGGKLSGDFNCVKNGVSYPMVTKSLWSLERIVVIPAYTNIEP